MVDRNRLCEKQEFSPWEVHLQRGDMNERRSKEARECEEREGERGKTAEWAKLRREAVEYQEGRVRPLMVTLH